MSELTARVVADRSELDAIVPEWAALNDQSARGTIFLTPEWQLTWLDTIPGVSPRYIVVSDETGRMRALLPLALRNRRVGRLTLRTLELGGEAVSGGDHLGLVVRAEDAAAAWRAAVPVVRSCAASADLVRFASMDAAEAASAIAIVPTGAGWSACHPRDEVAPCMPLPAPGGDVLAAVRSTRRAQFRNYGRRFARTFPSSVIAVNEERVPLDAALDALKALHASRWQSRGESGVIADPTFETFERRFAKRAFARGWLRLYQLFVEDRVVAALFVVQHRDVASFWIMGWHPEYAKWNVAKLLFIHSMRAASEEGARSYDFLRGSEDYKFQFPVDAPALLSRQWAITTRGKVAVQANRVGELVLASARRWRTRAARVAQRVRRVRE
jgi:CelD/BcsL family acetyltransferase involved in cellulose biosynthesis